MVEVSDPLQLVAAAMPMRRSQDTRSSTPYNSKLATLALPVPLLCDILEQLLIATSRMLPFFELISIAVLYLVDAAHSTNAIIAVRHVSLRSGITTVLARGCLHSCAWSGNRLADRYRR